MKIWLVKIGEIIPFQEEARKMRTAMLAEALIQRGHQVLWWTSAFDHFNKNWHFQKDTDFELRKGLRVKALKGCGYRKNISFSRWLDARLIATKFRRLAQEVPRPDVIVASSPAYDLAREAVLYARKNNIPVIVDIRDQWPDIFFEHIPSVLKPFARLWLSADFKIIKQAFKLADGLTAISEDLLNWGLEYAQREKDEQDRVFYLGFNRLDASKEEEVPQWLQEIKNKFIVVYQGTFNFYHDPSILIDCARILKNQEIVFVLAGKGELWEKVKDKAKGLPTVVLPGWLNQKELATLLNHSKVGVCPTPQRSYFLPNKAFAYFSAGLPVISSFAGELKEIIERYKVGFYYPPGDVDKLSEQIKFLFNNKEICGKMSENAQRLFSEKFDADKVYSDFVSYIEKMAEVRFKASGS